MIGITTVGRLPPRDGCDVLVGEKIVGKTTSGNYSPSLEHGIAIALINAQLALGSAVAIDVRGAQLDGVVVKLPFIAKS